MKNDKAKKKIEFDIQLTEKLVSTSGALHIRIPKEIKKTYDLRKGDILEMYLIIKERKEKNEDEQ